ncbi:Peptidase C1-like family [Porphyromonas macacae]|uniref:Aminopeptidase n=1 Tax=Porphyromonas macacae TaxID=28115 RepID=A0A379DGW4_9PORP|nr:C1 family peptidase [Porphyromonas macacae]SUB77263.1 Peptidase C1-like family [Porphyromonas macacae]
MKKFLLFAAVALGTMSLTAQKPEEKTQPESNKFTVIKECKITSVKNQANSGTCWSYSAGSFLESELLRMGKGEYDLSEMFTVAHSYLDKGEKFVRLHGQINYAQGGSFYDVLYVLKHYGAVPQEVYQGLNYGTDKNMFGELDSGSKAFLNAIIKNPNGKLSTAWKPAHRAIIEAYLGKIPENFTYKGKNYTPKSFANMLGLNADDYISITSFTHHPFYSRFVLEIEDNWRWAKSYNIPIEEMMAVIENAIDKGFTVAWGTDVSEDGFTRNGVGVLTDAATIETKGSDQARWVGLSHADKRAEIARMVQSPTCPEINPTQEYRQKSYDNWTLTDDHGMEIYGLAKNQAGKKFFMVKNSWGETGAYKGIWYASWNFVAGRTMNIVVHKDAIPAAIAKKMGIKK